jgi:glutathione synthase
MDHISTVSIAGDTSFALSLEAQRRGHQLFHYTPDRLSLRGGKVFARIEEMQVRDEKGNHYSLGEEVRTDLSEMDVVLLRQDPPFDMNYITITHLLEYIHPTTLVVNDPAEVRNAPEKLYVLRYGKFMPPTLITRDVMAVRNFRDEHGDVILKPLYGNGGAGVFRLAHGDENFAALVELFTQAFREPFIAQRYLPEVKKGDKRIILVDGEPAGAVNRVPQIGETRSNLHVGGRPEAADLTDRELEICAAIGPDLKARGLIFVGIDVIGGYLTEINVTSPTGLREIKRLGGPDVAALIWDAIERRRGLRPDPETS